MTVSIISNFLSLLASCWSRRENPNSLIVSPVFLTTKRIILLENPELLSNWRMDNLWKRFKIVSYGNPMKLTGDK